ncbi:unnamed protein product [Adineta ricciae]|uniref:Apple domain-containing protein n=1 Tax=Adineta ricciae TaxID=249248 RepID=A0A815XUA5_ADIRI|nr:unnamed protein product [Adineta ricciae]
MSTTNTMLLLLVVVVQQLFSQTSRSFIMSIQAGWQFQCENTTCVPLAMIAASDIQYCRINCLARRNCQAATFQNSAGTCKLFTGIENQYNNLITNVDVVTMIVMANTRIPTESTTTLTSSSTTTSTTTTSTKTTSTSTTSTTTIPYSPCSRSFCCTSGYSQPCALNGYTCNCTALSGQEATIICPVCVGQGPSDYMGSGACYYSHYYYSTC